MPAGSDSPDDLAWFAVQTRPRWEKFVKHALEGKGFEAFLPSYKSRRRWSDRIKELDLPLFAGYLFCRVSIQERRLAVLTTPGVRQIVGVGGGPIAVSQSEIDAVRAIVTSGLATRPWPFVGMGDRVRLRGGSLDGVEGILIATKTRHRLVVSVETLSGPWRWKLTKLGWRRLVPRLPVGPRRFSPVDLQKKVEKLEREVRRLSRHGLPRRAALPQPNPRITYALWRVLPRPNHPPHGLRRGLLSHALRAEREASGAQAEMGIECIVPGCPIA